MGDLIPLRSPRQREEKTASLGMIIFLASWVMLFASLFFIYGGLRSIAPAWPPADLPRLPLALPGLNLAIVAFSSLSLQLGLSAVRSGSTQRVAPLLGFATLLGAVFMVLQIVVWQDLYFRGLHPNTGTYASVFYALTFFHALHVVIGLFALAWLTVRARLSTPARHTTLRLWTSYWHFVGIVWAAMYVSVYVL